MKLERIFEKELAKDLRKETADRIKDARKEVGSFDDLNKLDKKEKKDKINELKSSGWFNWERDSSALEKMQKDIWGKIFKTEKFKERKEILDEVLKFKKETNINQIKNEYNKKFEEILKNCPLTPEEREKYLNTEAMEKMNLEDYLVLLKRLSGEAFYHVTRYGVRENILSTSGVGHNFGEGSFVDSFIPLLKDGKIKSATSTLIDNPELIYSDIKKDRILKYKKEGVSQKDLLNNIMKGHENDYPLDRQSTHVSFGIPLHCYYGAEKDYSFYFYYPVEYILQNDFYTATRSSHRIGGGIPYDHRPDTYNDFEIFNFGKGIPINAGILCIKDDIRVDPNTGSQYILENGNPLIDENGEFKKPEKTISSKEYWENYFKTHPEVKPNKIIYGGYGGYSDKNPELKSWGEKKMYHNQNEDKKEEVENYIKETTKEIRKIFTDVIKKYYEEE